MEEVVQMYQRELDRYIIIKKVVDKKMSQRKAAES